MDKWALVSLVTLPCKKKRNSMPENFRFHFLGCTLAYHFSRRDLVQGGVSFSYTLHHTFIFGRRSLQTINSETVCLPTVRSLWTIMYMNQSNMLNLWRGPARESGKWSVEPVLTSEFNLEPCIPWGDFNTRAFQRNKRKT